MSTNESVLEIEASEGFEKLTEEGAAEAMSSAVFESLGKVSEATKGLRQACEYWKRESRRQAEKAARWQAVASAATARAQNQGEHLAKLYQSLRPNDLPTQILRICMELTGAEQGLFTSPDGCEQQANIGLDTLTHVPRQALFNYTRQAAEKGGPVVENDGTVLPDGPQLVNLAAVPVALRDAPAGVLLVANKRSGPFTDADTDTLLAVGRHAGTAMRNQKLHADLNAAFESTIAVLADAIMAKDAYTRGHSDEVSDLTVQVAERLGIVDEELDALRYGALLHDIGKIGVPDGILMKPGKLTPEERVLIERHPVIGADLVARVASLHKVAPIVRHHHEKVDGTGYPDRLTGDAIPLASRIIAVVDAFNAMTTQRPYRLPISQSEALAELRRCAGAQFDTRVVEAVASLLAGEEH